MIRHRSAITGRFVKEGFAKKYPYTTIRDQMGKKKNRPQHKKK